MKTQMVALEGLSFSGKTSAVEQLKSNGSFLTIAELSNFHDGGRGFPKEGLNGWSTEEVDEWFLRAEERRCSHAIKLANGSKISTVIFDRCFLSIVVHALATSLMLKRKMQTAVIEEIHKSIERRNLINPNILYLKIDIKTHEQRYKEYFQKHRAEGQRSQFEQFRIDRYDRRRVEIERGFYDAIFSSKPELVVDARKDMQKVHEEILDRICKKRLSSADPEWILNEIQRFL